MTTKISLVVATVQLVAAAAKPPKEQQQQRNNEMAPKVLLMLLEEANFWKFYLCLYLCLSFVLSRSKPSESFMIIWGALGLAMMGFTMVSVGELVEVLKTILDPDNVTIVIVGYILIGLPIAYFVDKAGCHTVWNGIVSEIKAAATTVYNDSSVGKIFSLSLSITMVALVTGTLQKLVDKIVGGGD